MKNSLISTLVTLVASYALTSAPVAAQTTTLIPLSGTWNYLDTGVDPGGSWSGLAFNDAGWKVGAAELGYGDTDEATIVGFGPDANNKFPTTWFRKVINVPNPSAFGSVNMSLVYDDGAVVYVNGTEVYRINLPEGPVTPATFATQAADYSPTTATIPVGNFVAGNNVVAVEMHQGNATSSDVSFALELTAEIDTTPPTIATLVPPAGSIVPALFSIEVIFSEPVQGVTASDLLVNGQPATNITFGIPGQFIFTFPPPPTGAVSVAFIAGHGITDLAPTPNAFAGGNWSYTVDPNILPSTFLISEFMASNTKSLNDNYGNQSDWIEIFNPGQSAGNLLGWYLTDETNNLTKWKFPSRQIDPGAYIVVFASGRDETNNPAFLHTSFQLGASGEYLALVDPNTNIVSQFYPTYPPQNSDVSYGRDRLNPTLTGYFTTPTPRAANSTSGNGFGPEVVFSRNSGTFPTNQPFNLVLSTPVPNSSIFYSFGTNVPGSNVSATVFRYTNPVLITNTTAIRARAFVPGALPGPIETKIYIGLSSQTNVLGFNSELPIMIVHNYGQGTFTASSTDQKYAFIQTFENDCGVASMTNAPRHAVRCIMHPRGSSTLAASSGKASYFVELRDEFDDDLEVPLLGLPAESDWILYAPNGFEPALFHNPLAFQLAQDGGEYASRYRFVELYQKDDAGVPGAISSTGFTGANGDYNGIYVLEEKIKRDNNRIDIAELEPEHTTAPEVTGGYLLSIDRTDADKGTISAGGSSLNVLEPNWAAFNSPTRVAQRNYIQSYMNAFNAGLSGANLTNATLAAGAINTNHHSQYINVESWVRRHVHEVLTFNVDALRLSGYFYKDRNKKLEYGPAWDYDRTQGSTDGRDANPRTWRSTAGDLGTDFFNFTPWWGTLFRAPDFWQAWIDRYQSERQPGGSLTTTNVFARIDQLYNTLKDAQPRERLRWNINTRGTNGTGNGTYADEIQWKKNWYASRLDFMDTNFLDMPTIGGATGLVPAGSQVTILPAGKSGTSLFYTTDGTDPRLPNGFISPSAVSNNGPVTLTVNSNMRIVARSWNPAHRNVTGLNNPPINSIWSASRAATVFTAVPPLRITEIMYHPADPPAGNTNDSDNFEYLEVRNTGATPLNVNRFRLRGGLDFDFPNTVLAAGQYAVIVHHAAAFAARHGSGPLVLGVYTNDALANDGDHLVLEGGFREPILDFNYQDNWYPATDGAGFSLVIRNDALPTSTWGDKASWRPSGVLNGTPGAADPGEVTVAAVVINEALTHTDPSPGDAIEVYNPAGAAVDISNWYLTDDFGTPKKYRIPAGTSIPAGGYRVFYESNSFGLGANNFALSSTGDELYLYSGNAAGELTGYVHGFDFGPEANGKTFGRHLTSTANDHFVTQLTPTLGTANSGPLVGPVVISEIHYHPPEILLGRGYVDNCIDEFVELHNTSTSPALLYDPAAPTNTWRLRDAVSYQFPQGVSIPAGGYILIVPVDPSDPGQAAGFRARNGVAPSVPLYGPFSGQLDNSGDSVELARPDFPNTNSVPYILVEKVAYNDVSPWPEAADGIGPSLSRRNDNAYANDPANWVAAALTTGSGYGGGTPPVITQQPSDTTVIGTLTATFTVVATGTGSLSYQWRFNGSPIQGGTSSILTLNNVRADQAGSYSCVVLNPSGAVISSPAQLTVQIPASIIIHPQDVMVRVRPDPSAAPTTNATFTAGATTFNPPLTYQWRFNGTNIPGANSTTLAFNNVTTNHFGAISCAISDGVGTIFTTNATLYPLVRPGLVSQPQGTVFVAPGGMVGLSCVVTGFPPPFGFEWRQGSSPLASNVVDSTVNVFTFVAPNTPFVTNTYRVVVKNLANTAPGVPSAFSAVITLPDTDGDGILDSVEDATAGFNKNDSADAAGDFDGDGMKNRDEIIAGTNPNDPASNLKVDQTSTPGVFNIQFIARAGRTYSIEYTDALGSGLWIKLGDVAARASDGVGTVPDPTGQPGRYYRIATPGSGP